MIVCSKAGNLVGATVVALVVLAAGAPAAASDGPLRECGEEVHAHPSDWLPELLKSKPILRQVLADAPELRFQIVVGEVVEEGNGAACLRLTEYRVDAEYTYPASAIKVVGAIGALRAMQRVEGWELDTPLVIEPLERTFGGEPFTVSPGAESNLAELLDRTLVVSSNLAFNSLYDIAGRTSMHRTMQSSGLDSVRLRHRLSQTKAPADAHAWAPQVRVKIGGEWREVEKVRGTAAPLPPHQTEKTALGRGYVDPVTGERVDEQMDFGPKNAISLRDLLAITVAVARPDLFESKAPFGLEPASLNAMREAMTKRPEADDEEATLALEARFKPLSPGVLTALGGDRDRFTYVNKAGRAYGFHLDSAYVRDEKTGRSFFVATTLWPNANQVLNDNIYEYETLSYPALVAIGEVLTRELLLKE